MPDAPSLPDNAATADVLAAAIRRIGDVDVIVIGDSEAYPGVAAVLAGALGWPVLLGVSDATFAAGRIAPHAARIDDSGTFPADLVREAAALGLMGVTVPAEWGGAGRDYVSYALAIEALAGASAVVVGGVDVGDARDIVRLQLAVGRVRGSQ